MHRAAFLPYGQMGRRLGNKKFLLFMSLLLQRKIQFVLWKLYLSSHSMKGSFGRVYKDSIKHSVLVLFELVMLTLVFTKKRSKIFSNC